MTKFPSKEIWNLRDSLRRAKARCSDYYNRFRALETRVRDLERSRDDWRSKCQQMSEALREAGISPPGR
jgi:phage shock protein A